MDEFKPKKFTHLNFPLPLLQDAHKDIKSVMDDIFDIGVYNLAIAIYGYVDFEHYKLATMKTGFTFPNKESSFNNAIILYNKYGTNTPAIGLSTKIIFDYYKNPKDEFQISVLCAFCAVRSILGKKRICKTNKVLILERMFGYCSAFPKPNNASGLFKKYSNRYHMDKVLNELELSWGLKSYSNHNRGFYLSFTAGLSELAKYCETNKKKTKLEQLRQAKNNAKQKALNEIKELLNPNNNTTQ